MLSLSFGIHLVRKSAGMCSLVADVLENDLALGDALLEREVAAEEVPRAGWAADAGADLLVGEVVGAEEGGPADGEG